MNASPDLGALAKAAKSGILLRKRRRSVACEVRRGNRGASPVGQRAPCQAAAGFSGRPALAVWMLPWRYVHAGHGRNRRLGRSPVSAGVSL